MNRIASISLIGLLGACTSAEGPPPRPQPRPAPATPAYDDAEESAKPDLGSNDPAADPQDPPDRDSTDVESGPGPADEATAKQRTQAVLALLTDGKTANGLRVVATDDDRPFDRGLVRRMAPRVATPRVNLETPTVEGDLPKQVVRRVLRSRITHLRACYQRGLDTDVETRGRVVLTFEIDGRGRVSESRVAEQNLGNETVGNCMAKASQRLRFPRPRDGKPVKVRVGIDLEPASRGLAGL